MEEPHATPADRLEELLATLLEVPEPDRDAALDALCAQHAELADDLRKRFALFRRMLDSAPQPTTPATFGEFELVRELGRGGMGVVYLARQRRGETERQVALKLVQDRGLFSSQARERFRREAEAAFHDGGTFGVYPEGSGTVRLIRIGVRVNRLLPSRPPGVRIRASRWEMRQTTATVHSPGRRKL